MGTQSRIPDFGPAIRALEAFASEDALTDNERRVLREVSRRLARMPNAVQRLMYMNDRLLRETSLGGHLDPDTGEAVFRDGEHEFRLRLRPHDPSKPISIIETPQQFTSYEAGTAEPMDPDSEGLREMLEDAIELFYHSAHRVLKLLREVEALPKIRCRPVTIVRNQLVEHPEHLGEHGTIYSFGYTTDGPVVKPIQLGDPEHTDAGLLPNARAFIDAIVEGFSSTTR